MKYMMQHVTNFFPHNYYLFDVIIMATKEVIYRKRQGNGIPNILHVKRISYYQMIKEKVLMSSKVEESNLWKKWGSIEEDLMQIYKCCLRCCYLIRYC